VTSDASLTDARREAHQIPQAQGYPWLARAGLAARGVVFAIIGILALALAVGAGGETTNQKGALETIAHAPLGRVLLVALALGLAGYAIWRLVRAALGHGLEQTDSTGERIGALGSGLTYVLVCATAVEIIVGAGSSSSGSPRQTTAGVLGWTGGPELVAVAGVIVVGIGIYQLYKGLSRKFLKTTKTERMSPSTQAVFTTVGVAGHVARGVVFILAGYGIVRAAIQFDPNKAIGLDGALRDLAHAAYGPWLLGLVAVGLICFAAYSIADARYRRV
jgi:Domain of Unknown Function (DUF1206)